MVPGAVLLFFGKVIKLERKEQHGWTVGTVVIEGLDESGEELQTTSRSLMLQFQVGKLLLL